MAYAPGHVSGRAARAGGAVSGLLPTRQPAPEFALLASDGRRYVLREVLAEHRVLLAFYPGNDTPG